MILKFIATLIAAGFSISALAMEPLRVITPADQDYGFYSSAVNMDQKLVDNGWISVYADFNQWNVYGRIVQLRDGSTSNPYNLVLTVNGNLYYVDAVLNSVDSFKIRRRWRSNPEPGIFLRVEGKRLNPENGFTEAVQVWIKVATPEGRVLPVLKLMEGNYDLAESNSAEDMIVPAVWDGYRPGQPNPGPFLPPPL